MLSRTTLFIRPVLKYFKKDFENNFILNFFNEYKVDKKRLKALPKTRFPQPKKPPTKLIMTAEILCETSVIPFSLKKPSLVKKAEVSCQKPKKKIMKGHKKK